MGVDLAARQRLTAGKRTAMFFSLPFCVRVFTAFRCLRSPVDSWAVDMGDWAILYWQNEAYYKTHPCIQKLHLPVCKTRQIAHIYRPTVSWTPKTAFSTAVRALWGRQQLTGPPVPQPERHGPPRASPPVRAKHYPIRGHYLRQLLLSSLQTGEFILR